MGIYWWFKEENTIHNFEVALAMQKKTITQNDLWTYIVCDIPLRVIGQTSR
jgi:hypothetical protein